MLRLKPLPEEKAPEQTKHLYDAIKNALDVPSIPLFFQYIGNYPDYLNYIWEIVSPNIGTEGFERCCAQVVQMATSAVGVIYTPVEEVKVLSSEMHPSEKEQISHTVAELRTLNVKMMILTIAIRESMKGVHVSAKQLENSSRTSFTEPEAEKTIDEIVQESLLAVASSTSSPVQSLDAKVANMLVPIYGANSLIISKYPAFFSLSAKELERVMKTEAYLKTRVEMEKITHLLLMQLPSPIHISYVETAKMLFNKPHAGDLLFVIKDTFPSHFPKLVIATEMMEKMIKE